MPRTSRTAAPLAGNRDVAELLSILRKHSSPSLADFQELLDRVGTLEQQLEAAVQELTAMRRDLAEMERRRHPAANAMRQAVTTIQTQVTELREKLSALKQAVVEGCKNAVTAFRKKGIAALDNITRFFRVRPMLEAVQAQASHAAEAADRAVGRIEAASQKYHEAGRHLKNAGRALTGKDAIQKAKPPGKAAQAVSAPLRATRACFGAMAKGAASAADRLGRLEQAAKQQKPSIKETIRQYNREAEKVRAVPIRVRPRPHVER